jgi:hypothetical protein
MRQKREIAKFQSHASKMHLEWTEIAVTGATVGVNSNHNINHLWGIMRKDSRVLKK